MSVTTLLHSNDDIPLVEDFGKSSPYMGSMIFKWISPFVVFQHGILAHSGKYLQQMV